jgi:hypothetical protein
MIGVEPMTESLREVSPIFATGIFIAEEQTDTVGFLIREVTVSFAIGFISSPYYFDSYRYCHDKQTDEEAGTGKFGISHWWPPLSF